MAAKRRCSRDEGDQGQEEEDERSEERQAKLARLHSSDGENASEHAATDQEPHKEQEPQLGVAVKRAKSNSDNEQGEADPDGGVSEAKKLKVADDVTDDLAVEDVNDILSSADISGQDQRDGKESAIEDEGRKQKEYEEEEGCRKQEKEKKQEVGMEDRGVMDRDPLRDAISVVLISVELADDQEGRAGQDNKGEGLRMNVVVQTDEEGYERKQVVENDEGKQIAKEEGHESESSNADAGDESEKEQAKEEKKKESEKHREESDEEKASEQGERDVNEQKEEKEKCSGEDGKKGENEGDDDSGSFGDDEGEDEDKADSGEENEQDKDKAKSEADEENPVPIMVTYTKQTHVITLPLSATIFALKEEIAEHTGVQPEMQKLCYKGIPRPLLDNASLRDSGLSANAKILLVGCTVADLYTTMKPAPEDLEEPKAKKEPLCKQERHKNIIADGVPEDAFPGILNVNDPLPAEPLTGMLNRRKQKVRLTFKLEKDELWISTKEGTDKIPLRSISQVVSESIENHEEYHILALRLGQEAKASSWIYIYWVPAQYVKAIKSTLLG